MVFPIFSDWYNERGLAFSMIQWEMMCQLSLVPQTYSNVASGRTNRDCYIYNGISIVIGSHEAHGPEKFWRGRPSYWSRPRNSPCCLLQRCLWLRRGVCRLLLLSLHHISRSRPGIRTPFPSQTSVCHHVASFLSISFAWVPR